MRNFGVDGCRLPDSASSRPTLSPRPPARGLRSTPARVDPIRVLTGLLDAARASGRRRYASSPLPRRQLRCSSRPCAPRLTGSYATPADLYVSELRMLTQYFSVGRQVRTDAQLGAFLT